MVIKEDALREYLKTTYDALGFKPYDEQWSVLLSQERISLMSGGVRSGKSTVGNKYLMGRWDMEYDGEHPLLYWIAGKDYESTLKEFEYCALDTQKLGICLSAPHRFYPDSLELILGIEGKEIARIKNKSLKDELKIMAEAPDGILLCEAAQNTYSAYQKLNERTAEKRSWLFCTGTFEHEVQGWYPEAINYFRTPGVTGGKAFIVPSWANTAVFPGGREDPEIKRQEALLPSDIFMERFGGVPCKPEGIVIPEFSHQIHVGDYPFDPSLPVHITTDPGFLGAAAVLAIQVHGDAIWLIDEIYLHGYVTEEIIDICKRQPWWSNREMGTIDIAARQHPAAASPYEVWRERGGMHMHSQRVDERGGIDLLRMLMKPHPVSQTSQVKMNHSCAGFICECGGGKPPDLMGSLGLTHNDIDKWGPWLRDRVSSKPKTQHNHASKALIYYLANKVGYRDVGGFHQKVRIKSYA